MYHAMQFENKAGFMKKKGFTLIELLVVIAIIGLLATMAVVSFGNARMKARDTKRVHDLKSIYTALELYYDESGSYPTGTFDSRNATQWSTLSGYLTPAYMATLPIDPTNGGKDGSMCSTCGEYYYRSPNGQRCVLSTYLADASSPYVTGSNTYGSYHSITVGCASSDFWTCN
jgi:prepilin-type N-terminal cleavage/methylation domain-containing protein